MKNSLGMAILVFGIIAFFVGTSISPNLFDKNVKIDTQTESISNGINVYIYEKTTHLYGNINFSAILINSKGGFWLWNEKT